MKQVSRKHKPESLKEEEKERSLYKMKSTSTVCRSVKYGLLYVGIWPGTSFPILHKVYWVTFMAIFQAYQYKYVVMHFQADNLLEFVDTLSVTLPLSMMLVKLIIIWVYHGVLCDILTTMEEDCNKYAAIDKDNAISKARMFCERLASLIMTLYPVSVVMYTIGTFTYQKISDTMPRGLLLKMDLPFETTESPVYELVVTLQFLHLTSSAFSCGVLGSLLLMVTHHVGSQIDIMCGILADITSENTKQLKFLIKRHREIILFTERIEKLFTYMALSQLVSNTLITCGIGYVIVVSINTENGLPLVIKSVLFYGVICLDAFIYAFVGEYLNNKSEMMCNAAYESRWYDLHPNESRLIILLLLRSQKGFTLTFGKFSNLSMENFAAIMKVSASYMSVLLAMS